MILKIYICSAKKFAILYISIVNSPQICSRTASEYLQCLVNENYLLKHLIEYKQRNFNFLSEIYVYRRWLLFLLFVFSFLLNTLKIPQA